MWSEAIIVPFWIFYSLFIVSLCIDVVLVITEKTKKKNNNKMYRPTLKISFKSSSQ